MSDSPLISWRDVSVYLMWHSSGRCTIMSAFERADHSYVVCTPAGATTKNQDTYRSMIKPRAQEMEVSGRWKKRIYSAYNNGGGEAVSDVLSDLEDRDVREVIIHE